MVTLKKRLVILGQTGVDQPVLHIVEIFNLEDVQYFPIILLNMNQKIDEIHK